MRIPETLNSSTKDWGDNDSEQRASIDSKVEKGEELRP